MTMDSTQVLGGVLATLSALLTVPIDRLGGDTSRENQPAWDSLKHMHLVLALEEQFGIEFDDDEVSSLADVSSLVRSIESKTPR
jgi:acyl carrier protein